MGKPLTVYKIYARMYVLLNVMYICPYDKDYQCYVTLWYGMLCYGQ